MPTLRDVAFGLGGVWAASAAARWLSGELDLEGRVALVTGGSRGLGLVLARELVREGARVAIVARDRDELSRAAADLESRGGEVLALMADLTDREQARDTVARVKSRFGSIDVLVNNAGTLHAGPFENMTFEEFQQALDVHLWAPLATIVAAVPHMKRAGGGRIVNIVSIGGKIAVPHLLPYCASKFALSGLSEGLRAELAKDGILVTTVYPGLMRTGSPGNAFFKGQHESEHAWFAVLAANPLVSVDARRAAISIVRAMKRGDPRLVISLPAKLGVIAATLFPNVTAMALDLTARLLPSPAPGPEGDEARKGSESESRWAPSVLTWLNDRAAVENNETNGRHAA